MKDNQISLKEYLEVCQKSQRRGQMFLKVSVLSVLAVVTTLGVIAFI
jgi:hypothetical protein